MTSEIYWSKAPLNQLKSFKKWYDLRPFIAQEVPRMDSGPGYFLFELRTEKYNHIRQDCPTLSLEF